MILELESEQAVFQEISRETAPVCLSHLQENPYGLVSLLDMLRFHADSFCRCSSLLGQMFVEIRAGLKPADNSWGLIGSEISELEKHCEDMELVVTLSQIRRIKKMVHDGQSLDISYFGQQLIEVQTRLNDELAARWFFSVSPERAKFYEENAEPFGHEATVAFPSNVFDLTEGKRCFALGRSTACVFHLMRALEIVLGVFAARFGLPSDHTNWHNIIEGIEKAVRGMGADPARSNDWKDQQEFYSQAASHFMVMKDAWRNYTAHARGKYTDEEAQTLIINVRSFMQKLATRLHE